MTGIKFDVKFACLFFQRGVVATAPEQGAQCGSAQEAQAATCIFTVPPGELMQPRPKDPCCPVSSGLFLINTYREALGSQHSKMQGGVKAEQTPLSTPAPSADTGPPQISRAALTAGAASLQPLFIVIAALVLHPPVSICKRSTSSPTAPAVLARLLETAFSQNALQTTDRPLQKYGD